MRRYFDKYAKDEWGRTGNVEAPDEQQQQHHAQAIGGRTGTTAASALAATAAIASAKASAAAAATASSRGGRGARGKGEGLTFTEDGEEDYLRAMGEGQQQQLVIQEQLEQLEQQPTEDDEGEQLVVKGVEVEGKGGAAGLGPTGAGAALVAPPVFVPEAATMAKTEVVGRAIAAPRPQDMDITVNKREKVQQQREKANRDAEDRPGVWAGDLWNTAISNAMGAVNALVGSGAEKGEGGGVRLSGFRFDVGGSSSEGMDRDGLAEKEKEVCAASGPADGSRVETAGPTAAFGDPSLPAGDFGSATSMDEEVGKGKDFAAPPRRSRRRRGRRRRREQGEEEDEGRVKRGGGARGAEQPPPFVPFSFNESRFVESALTVASSINSPRTAANFLSQVGLDHIIDGLTNSADARLQLRCLQALNNVVDASSSASSTVALRLLGGGSGERKRATTEHSDGSSGGEQSSSVASTLASILLLPLGMGMGIGIGGKKGGRLSALGGAFRSASLRFKPTTPPLVLESPRKLTQFPGLVNPPPQGSVYPLSIPGPDLKSFGISDRWDGIRPLELETQSEVVKLLYNVALSDGGDEAIEQLRNFPDVLDALKKVANGGKRGKYARYTQGTLTPVQRLAHKTLAMAGEHVWVPKSKGQRGLRILCFDGGGTRGVLTVQLLKKLTEQTGKEPTEMFDVIMGTSTGGIVAALIGIQGYSVATCESMYDTLIHEIFQRNPVGGVNLALKQAFYDDVNWMKILRRIIGDQRMIDSADDPLRPKIACPSTVISVNPSKLCLWRNYNYPKGYESRYSGEFRFLVRECIRATTAAPTFFSPLLKDSVLYSDGALLANNPTGVAIHEARKIFPGMPIEAVVSLGTGCYWESKLDFTDPAVGWDGIVNQLVASATETEQSHDFLLDFMPSDTYFRFNPKMGTKERPMDVSIDETRLPKLNYLKALANEYLEEPEVADRMRRCAELLST